MREYIRVFVEDNLSVRLTGDLSVVVHEHAHAKCVEIRGCYEFFQVTQNGIGNDTCGGQTVTVNQFSLKLTF